MWGEVLMLGARSGGGALVGGFLRVRGFHIVSHKIIASPRALACPLLKLSFLGNHRKLPVFRPNYHLPLEV
jgi:hypothetical protein